MYVDIVISNAFNLNKKNIFLSFLMSGVSSGILYHQSNITFWIKFVVSLSNYCFSP